MRAMLGAVPMAVLLMATAAVAQTAAPPATAPAVQAPPAAAAAPPLREGKRDVCRRDVDAKGLRGQAKRDEMQLCVAQAQLDCVKQAIDAKTVGMQRRDFMKNCMGSKERSPI